MTLLGALCISLIALGSLLTKSASAAAPVLFTLVGVENFNTLVVSGQAAGAASADVTSQAGFGAGALLDFPLGPRTWFQFGLLYVTRSSESNGTAFGQDDITTTSHVIQIPLLFRFKPIPYFSMGLGGYWANAIGNITVADATQNSTQNLSYVAANRQPTGLGLLVSAALHLPLSGDKGPAFFLDGRVAYGLTELYSAGTVNSSGSPLSEYSRDYQVLAGFQLPLGLD